MNKLKIAGLVASAAGFVVSLVAGAIDDKKMEEAVDKAVDKKLGIQEVDSEPVSGKGTDQVADYSVVAEY